MINIRLDNNLFGIVVDLLPDTINIKFVVLDLC